MSAGRVKRTMRAKDRSLVNVDAYRLLHMQMIGRRRARLPLSPFFLPRDLFVFSLVSCMSLLMNPWA